MISFLYNFFMSVVNGKDPEPKFVSAPAPGGSKISAPRLSAPAPPHWIQHKKG